MADGQKGYLGDRAKTEPVALAQFGVKIDGLDLGFFTGCEGLSAEFTFEEYQEGGSNGYVHKLPGRVKYANVKLTRLISKDSTKLATWISDFGKAGKAKRPSAVITMVGADAQTICTWTLKEVHPVRWTGPSFAADGNGVAKETLEIAHHGFDWKA